MAFWQNNRRSRARRRPTNNTPAQVETFEDRMLLAGVTDNGSVVDPITLDGLASNQEFASIDGTGNNIDNPELGSTDEALLRLTSAEYEDGTSSPAGADWPSAREVSNAIAAVDSLVENDRYLTDFLWIWGQFIDHDIDLTENADPAEALPIEVSAGDPFFDPFNTGTETIDFNRSISEVDAEGVRQQINQITAFLDGSVVYGSDQERADELRTFEGGLLKTSEGDLLPFNEAGLANAGGTSDALFLAGDVRANENVALSSMHTIWVREHNRIATELAAQDPTLTDEQLYQQARAIVTGEIQAITYNEYLPALLGFDALSEYQGYDPSVDPSISNIFSTAAYRFGHSLLSPELQRLNSDGSVAAEGNLALQDAFFRPDQLVNNGIDSLLQGAATQIAQELDNQVVDDVRNFLFGPPGAGGFDLASLNIQRGRDHGLPDYNQARIDLGLAPVQSFSDITSDPDLAAKLEQLYGDVNNIDVWVGGLAEDHLPGSSMGELFQTVLVDQFERLRDGDRFYYENVFTGSQLQEIDNTTLADVIQRNSNVTGLQDNVFFAPTVEYVDLTQMQADNVTIRQRGSNVEIVDNRTRRVISSRTASDMDQLIIVGSDDVREQVTIAPMNPAMLPGGLVINTGDNDGDTLIFRGTGGRDSFIVDGTTVTMNGMVTQYSDVERIMLDAQQQSDNVVIADDVDARVMVNGQQPQNNNGRRPGNRPPQRQPQTAQVVMNNTNNRPPQALPANNNTFTQTNQTQQNQRPVRRR
ncbi:MAG: peroxidase family protein [Planctomycetaceae bacterium]